MKENDAKELLYQQLQLLAEKSEKYQDDLESLLKLSAEMDRIANTLLRCMLSILDMFLSIAFNSIKWSIQFSLLSLAIAQHSAFLRYQEQSVSHF